MTCAKTELCIFDNAMPQVVVENASFEEIFPINTITGKENVDVEFNIIGSTTDYLDLNDTLLYVQVKVVKSDLKELDKDTDIIPVNYLFHSLFRDVILSLNNEKIEGGNQMYAHKARLETIINYSTDTKKTNLASIGYETDAAKRTLWIAKSKTFGMCGSIQLDFFKQPKYLIPGVNVHLRLQRTNSSFCLTSKTLEPILLFTDVKLLVRRVKVEQSVLIGHQLGLNTRNSIYPYTKTQLVSYSLAQGTLAFYKDQVFGDVRLPKFILICFQKTSPYNGTFLESSIEYGHFNVSSITLSKNNEYREIYTQDFDKDNYVTSYVKSLIRNMGHLDKNLNLGITLAEFKDVYPFFTFVLAPDFDVYTTQLPKQGNLRLDIKFNSGLAKPTSVLVYGIFDSEIQINNNRTVFV